MRKSCSVMVALAMAVALVLSVHGSDCSTVLNLSPFKPCIPVVVGTAPALPNAKCCNAIKKADLLCLCTAVSTSTILDLNREAALMLPKKCGVVPPSLNTCGKFYGNPFVRKPTVSN